MNTSNLSSDGGVCHNHCQLGRDLVSGGLLAGGVFWILATVVMFAAEVTGVSSGETVVTSTFLEVLGILSAMLKSVVGVVPGYRMVLALIGVTMVLQSRFLSAVEAQPVALFGSGLVGLGLQIYNASGGAIWVSGLFAALIVAGLILSAIWISGERKDRVPVYVDANGQHFARVNRPEISSTEKAEMGEQSPGEGRVGLFSGAEDKKHSDELSDRRVSAMDIIDQADTAPLASPDPVRVEEEHIELPPMPPVDGAVHGGSHRNVTPFPARKTADRAVQPSGGSEAPSTGTTQEIEKPPITDIEPFEDESPEIVEEVEHELEKTMVIERPAFLDEK